jgi:hypothetical protein
VSPIHTHPPLSSYQSQSHEPNPLEVIREGVFFFNYFHFLCGQVSHLLVLSSLFLLSYWFVEEMRRGLKKGFMLSSNFLILDNEDLCCNRTS